MNITHIVIHELEKEIGKTGATLTVFDSTVDKSDTRVIKLIKELNNRYRYRSETYGVFDKKNQTTFHSAFDGYFKKPNEGEFIKFAKAASEDLKTSVKNISPARGGYLIYAHYEDMRKFIGVFLVRNTTGMSFKKGTKKFNIEDVTHIDFENLAMACRINLDAYQKKEIRYLSFISKKGDDMSNYFTSWISSTDTETNEEDTKKLYDLLHQVPPPKDIETNKAMDRYEFLDNVYSSIKSKPGRLVNIRKISEDFYGDADFLQEFIDKNNLLINGEFKAHPGSLRKFIQISAKADKIELKFPYTSYKEAVNFNPTNRNQIIIDSENLASQIREFIAGNN